MIRLRTLVMKQTLHTRWQGLVAEFKEFAHMCSTCCRIPSSVVCSGFVSDSNMLQAPTLSSACDFCVVGPLSPTKFGTEKQCMEKLSWTP